MSVDFPGELIKTRLTNKDETGRHTRVYHAKENGRVFRTCHEYYWYMMEMWDGYEAKETCYPSVPFSNNDRRNLELMCPGNSFTVEEDTVHVDNWAVNEEFILHKHPEFGRVTDLITHMPDKAELEFSIRDGKCDLCHTQVPGEIEFLHKMYQL